MVEAKRIGTLPSGHPRLLGPPAETALHTEATGLVAGAVWVPVSGGALPAYRARPDGPGPRNAGFPHSILHPTLEIHHIDAGDTRRPP